MSEHTHSHTPDHAHAQEHTHTPNHDHTHAPEHAHAQEHSHTPNHDHTHAPEHAHAQNHAHTDHRDDFNALTSGDELLALLSFMAHHNKEHLKDLEEWSAETEGEANRELHEAIRLYHEANQHLEEAVSLMKKQTKIIPPETGRSPASDT